MDVIILIKLIVALGIFNVWILRYNQHTQYRGGKSKSLKEEFDVYGLPNWSLYLVGAIKIILAVGLILAIWITQITIYASAGMGILMIGAIMMHVKIKDPLKKSLPALSMLLLLMALCMEAIN